MAAGDPHCGGDGGGRVPVWAGCTHNATREAVAKARAAAQVPGVTAILSANPYYNRPRKRGSSSISRRSPTRWICRWCSTTFRAELAPTWSRPQWLRLVEAAPNIEAVKESSGQLGQITELIHLLPDGFKVFSGDDPIALPVICGRWSRAWSRWLRTRFLPKWRG